MSISDREPGRAPACPFHFDPLEPAQREDPYPTYARARREQPVFYAAAFDLWILTRYDDVVAAAKEDAGFSSVGAVQSSVAEPPPQVRDVLAQGYPGMPVLTGSDRPLHTRIRGLVNKAFSPRRIAAMEPRIRALAGGLIDGFARDGETEIIERFAWPLPLIVIGEMLGVPGQDLDDLHRWSRDWLLLQQGTGSLEEQVARARSTVAFQGYIAAALEDRRRAPRDDLMTAILEARERDEAPLSTEETVGVALTLVVAGHLTVTRAIGSALLLIFRYPDQRATLAANPGVVANAVEEILRVESPAQGLFRTTTREVTVGGVTIPQGARVMLHYGSSNRDEGQFADPERFDIQREDATRHLAFGKGIHFCIGAPLARLELQIALPLLLHRLPNLRLHPSKPFTYDPIFFARGLTQLHVEWHPLRVDAAAAGR